MRHLFALALLALLATGCGKSQDDTPSQTSEPDPPEESQPANPEALANQFFGQAVQSLKVAKLSTGRNALLHYEKALNSLERVTTECSETTLAVRLLSGESILLGKTLQQIELRRSKLKGLPDSVLDQLDSFQVSTGELHGDAVTNDALEHLQSVPLISLSLNASRVSDSGLEYLREIASLRNLVLDGTMITDAGTSHLRELIALRSLSLANTPLTDLGLANLTRLTGLESLILYNTRVSDVGLTYLYDMPSLKVLQVGGTQVTSAGVTALKDRVPSCKVTPDATLLAKKKPTLSTPEETLSLYLGAVTWEERFAYTTFAVESNGIVGRRLMKEAYSALPDTELWPRGVLYDIESMTATTGEEGDTSAAIIGVNLSKAEGLSKRVVDADKSSVDCATLPGSYRYFFSYNDGYRIDWTKTRAEHEAKLASLAETLRDQSSRSRVEQQKTIQSRSRTAIIYKWDLRDAVIEISGDKRVVGPLTKVRWTVKNDSDAYIAGMTINIYVVEEGKKLLVGDLRIDNFGAGRTRVGEKQYLNNRGGRTLRQQGWTAEIKSLRLESPSEKFFAQSYYTLEYGR